MTWFRQGRRSGTDSERREPGETARREHAEAGARVPGDVPEARLHATVSGVVQGVGFRYWTMGEAEKRGLVGTAGNLLDGTVEVTAEGTREDVEALLAWLRSGNTPGHVDEVEATIGPGTGEFTRFSLF